MTLSALNADSLPATEFDRLSDEELAKRYQQIGCIHAMSELVKRHLRLVRAIIFPMVLDHATADDLTQETLVRAWRGLNGFRGDAKFVTWLTRIAWNVVQDHVARRERLPAIAMTEPYPSVCRFPDTELLHRELDEQIQAALADLSPKLRAAIVLTGLQEFRPEEAAEMEGCTVSAMYCRIHEARRLLEQRLKGYLNT